MSQQVISKRPRRVHGGAIAVLVLALAAWAGPVAAQESWDVSREASPADVSSLDAIIAALYLPGARFVVVSRDESGRLVARNMDHGSFAAGSNASLEQGFYEREINRVTRQFGPITDVFSTYEWSRTADGPIGGRGINSIQLYNDGERWWITGAMWASEESGNPIPTEYLPD